MKRSVLTSDFEKRHSVPPMHVSQQAIRKQKKVGSGSFYYMLIYFYVVKMAQHSLIQTVVCGWLNKVHSLGCCISDLLSGI